MLKRSDKIELLDESAYDDKYFYSAIKYLEKTNKWFGNYWLIIKYLKKFIQCRNNISILDFGSGTTDISRFLSNYLDKKKISSTITCIDSNTTTLKIAIELSKEYKNIDFIDDIKKLNPTSKYNVAILSQVLHHLNPDEVKEYIKIIYENTTDGIIISDLIRSRFAYWLVRILTLFTTTNPINRYDGPLSVLRSYTDNEIKQIFNSINIKNFKIYNFFPRKIIVIKKLN